MEVQRGVKQQSVDIGQWQSSFAAFLNDTQDRFGFLQCAYLPFSKYRKTPPALRHVTGSPSLRLLRQGRDLAALAGEAIPKSPTTRPIQAAVCAPFRPLGGGTLSCSTH